MRVKQIRSGEQAGGVAGGCAGWSRVEWEYRVTTLCKEPDWGLLTLPKQVQNTSNMSVSYIDKTENKREREESV